MRVLVRDSSVVHEESLDSSAPIQDTKFLARSYDSLRADAVLDEVHALVLEQPGQGKSLLVLVLVEEDVQWPQVTVKTWFERNAY